MFLKREIWGLLRGCAVGASVLISACGGGSAEKTENSQVVAKVNGVEVTDAELSNEIESNTRPGTQLDDAQRMQFLDQIVKRKLLVEAARSERLDKSPEYLARIQRQNELMLAQMLVGNWEKSLDRPTPEQIKNYIASNPDKFANRKGLVIDRLTAPGKLPFDMTDLRNLSNIKAIYDMLSASSVKANVERLQIDSAQAQGVLLQQVRNAKVGKPMIEVQDGKLFAVQVLEIKPIPVPPAQWEQLAAQAIRGEQMNKLIDDRLKAQTAKAKIEYSNGYSAPKAAPSPSAEAK